MTCLGRTISNGEDPFSSQSSSLTGSNIRGSAAEREVRRITDGEPGGTDGAHFE